MSTAYVPGGVMLDVSDGIGVLPTIADSAGHPIKAKIKSIEVDLYANKEPTVTVQFYLGGVIDRDERRKRFAQ